MPIVGGVGTGGGGGGGGTNSTQTELRHYTVPIFTADSSIVSLNEQTVPGQVVANPGLACAWVQYPSGYNGSIRASGINARTQSNDTETLTNTGAGAVTGSKVWVGPITYTNNTPGGTGSHNASLGLSKRLCVPEAPVADFVAVRNPSDDAAITLSSEDLTAGWVSTSLTPSGIESGLTVFYTVSHTHTIS